MSQHSEKITSQVEYDTEYVLLSSLYSQLYGTTSISSFVVKTTTAYWHCDLDILVLQQHLQQNRTGHKTSHQSTLQCTVVYTVWGRGHTHILCMIRVITESSSLELCAAASTSSPVIIK